MRLHLLPAALLMTALNATAYPADLERQLLDYHACLARQDGATCTRELYAPIYRYCENRTRGCPVLLDLGYPGPLSFKRCSQKDSCAFAGLQSPERHLNLRLAPAEERAEVRDPYLSPYGETIRFSLSIRVPSSSTLDNDNASIVIAQWHATNGQSPSFALRLKPNGDLAITVRHQTEYSNPDQNGREVIVSRVPFRRDEWHDLEILARSGPDGRLSVADNGIPLADYHGPLGYKDLPNYFKVGPYDYTRTQKSAFEVHFRAYDRHALHYKRVAGTF